MKIVAYPFVPASRAAAVLVAGGGGSTEPGNSKPAFLGSVQATTCDAAIAIAFAPGVSSVRK